IWYKIRWSDSARVARTVMGIHDRDYARDDEPSGGASYSEAGLATRWLRGITIGVVVLQAPALQSPPSGQGDPGGFLHLSPALVWEGQVWRLLTYGFVHSVQEMNGILQLVFNMMILWFFGRALEDRHGSREFVVFYVLSILLGGLAYVVTGPLLHPWVY